MNEIGVYICNFNGKDWVIGCVESLKEQTLKSFDIHIVDNASTDGSVGELTNRYGNDVEILVNEKNLGGAGGFDRGLRDGIQKKYKYVVLLDNDIKLDKNMLANMYEYLEENKKVGIVGAKVMIMDEPELVQDFGCRLDFNKYKEYPQYQFKKEDETPDLWECDYVPTCAVMARTDALRNSGTMPVDNFIYYDDIEMSYRLKQNGYKVVALGNAKVFHKGGFRKAEKNTFPKYYFTRNRLHFFSKFVPLERTEDFIEVILSEIYAQLFGFYIKGGKELFYAVNTAFHDYLGLVRGKAAENRIIPISDQTIPFINLFADSNAKIKIRVIDNYIEENPLDLFGILIFWFREIQRRYELETIAIGLEDCNYGEEEFIKLWEKSIEAYASQEHMPKLYITKENDSSFDQVIRMCTHVKDIKEDILPEVWADRYANCVYTKEIYQQAAAYRENENFFKEVYRPIMAETIAKIKSKM